uniref:Breast cancer anti-estrogen resistance protein 1 n=1 Tax=Hydra vulgaris TaxID=6087 RepID=T2MEZ5_HYDVU
MGWNTLKRMKSKDKDKNYMIKNDAQLINGVVQIINETQKTKNDSNSSTTSTLNNTLNTLNASNSTLNSPASKSNSSSCEVIEDKLIQTLLAKAIYDNFADAPDELSFRKGDIVTVIEQDVDGLLGWWLCLLHGRQGIVPGNRLQVIPPMELDKFEKSTRKRGSYETDDSYDSADLLENGGHSYDVLPNPVKSNPTTLTIKDMFHIPLKKDVISNESFNVTSYEKSKNLIKEDAKDIYDVPSNQQEFYDVPKFDKNEKLNKTVQNITLNRNENKSFDSSNISLTSDGSKILGNDLYDVPVCGNNAFSKKNQSIVNKDSLKVSKQDKGLSNDLDIATLMDEIYDSPFSADCNSNTIKRSPKSSNQTTPRNSRHSQELNTSTKVSNENIYNNLSTKIDMLNLKDQTSTQKVVNKTVAKVFEEVYDIPLLKGSNHSVNPFQPKSTPTKSENADVYDVPSKNTSHYFVEDYIADDIYDIPRSGTELYDTPLTRIHDHNNRTQELYDVPQNNKTVNAEIRKDPLKRNINQELNYTAYSPHCRERKNNPGNLVLPDTNDDDYIDYHDIWNNEPPKELAQEHITSSSSSQNRNNSNSSNSSNSSNNAGDHKKSLLDQINFEAVKELDITVSEALERLRKLHLAVDTCVHTLLSFCVNNWLDISFLQNNIVAIRDYSGKLKTALRLLTEFGLGTLVNTTRCVNGEALMDSLITDVESLLESYYKIKICILHLDGQNWAVPKTRSSLTDKFFATLNAIMILSQRIPDQCKLFTQAVQKNSSEFFLPDPVKVLTPAKNQSDSNKTGVKTRLFNENNVSSEFLKKELADRRQHARDNLQLAPRIPPKPTLPSERRSMAGTIEPPESPRVAVLSPHTGTRVIGHIERLVTDYIPDNIKYKKYASDPTTPYKDGQKTIWGGSCPMLIDRNSAAPLRGAESASSCSSIATSVIEEETIEIKQTNNEKINKNYPSDSIIISPGLTPFQQRSASVLQDNKNKNVFNFDEKGRDETRNFTALSPLDHRDIEALEFFCRQVESQVMLLRESMKNLTESVENREEPAIFVSHSKFVILTAHKVVHSGQEISERLVNQIIKNKLKEGTTHLTLCIRGVVAATKTAALEFPDPAAMMEMISSVLAIGDAVRIIHSECRRALDS